MRGLRAMIAAGAVVAGMACGGETLAPAIDSGTGTWTGTSDDIVLTLHLHDLGGALHGDGVLVRGQSASAFNVLDGTWGQGANKVHAMTLTFTGEASAPATFTCTTQVAERCDGALRYRDGNAILFEVVR